MPFPRYEWRVAIAHIIMIHHFGLPEWTACSKFVFINIFQHMIAIGSVMHTYYDYDDGVADDDDDDMTIMCVYRKFH